MKKGKLIFLLSVHALIFRNPITGNCQQGISTGRNSVTGNPHNTFVSLTEGRSARDLPKQQHDDTEMTGPTIEGEITTPQKLKPLWTVSSRLLTILPSLLMRNTTFLSPSFLSPVPGPLLRSISVLTSHFWNATSLRTCFLAVPAHTILDAWLKLLSEAIVHGIFDPHHAVYTPPPLPGPLMSPRFWHDQLNHACIRAISPLGGAGTTDKMAGDQLAVWNQVNVNSNEPIPSTHLTIFVPPSLGAFILANLKSPTGTPHSSVQLYLLNLIRLLSSLPLDLFTSTSLPTFLKMKTSIMDNAGQAAAAGFIRPESIPLLALTDESFYRGNLVGRSVPVPPPDTSLCWQILLHRHLPTRPP